MFYFFMQCTKTFNVEVKSVAVVKEPSEYSLNFFDSEDYPGLRAEDFYFHQSPFFAKMMLFEA